MSEKVKIMFDTNFLLTMVRHKIHGFEELKQKLPCEFYTLSRVEYELKVLAKNDKKIKKEVAIVEQILKNNKVKIIDSLSEDVDTELVKYSKEGCVIATNDKILRERVRREKGKSIYVRSLTYVDVEDLLEQ